MRKSQIGRLFLVMMALLSSQMGVSFAQKTPFTQADFARACDVMAITEIKRENGVVILKEKYHGRTFLVTTVTTIDGKTYLFESIEKNDSIYVIDVFTGNKGANYTRAKSFKAYDKGKFETLPIFTAKDHYVHLPAGRKVTDKVFFFEAAHLLVYTEFMPYTSTQLDRKLGKIRWFNLPQDAALDSLNAWSKHHCGKKQIPIDLHTDGQNGFAYFECD